MNLELHWVAVVYFGWPFLNKRNKTEDVETPTEVIRCGHRDLVI